MFQGYYNLTANMITQNRNLNVISNNMTNVSTPGYKEDRIMQSTFLYQRWQNIGVKILCRHQFDFCMFSELCRYCLQQRSLAISLWKANYIILAVSWVFF